MTTPITPTGITLVAEAIFKGCPSAVVEAYSEPDQELRSFQSAQELCTYAATKESSPEGSVHIVVHYHNMAGKVTHTRIPLNPKKCNGHTFRIRTDGWGLISVYLQLRQGVLKSSITANSAQRAQKWSHTHPELEPPAMWIWPAVACHLRRLRAVLKLAA